MSVFGHAKINHLSILKNKSSVNSETKRAKESSVNSVNMSLQLVRCLNPWKLVGKVVRIQPDSVSLLRRLQEKRAVGGVFH